jgi:hypothetical protein
MVSSLLRDSLVLGVSLGAPGIPLTGGTFQKSSNAAERGEKEPEVTATENLMRTRRHPPCPARLRRYRT